MDSSTVCKTDQTATKFSHDWKICLPNTKSEIANLNFFQC